jgi:hypothetical protein
VSPLHAHTFRDLSLDHDTRLGVRWMYTPTGIMGLRRAKDAPKGNGKLAMEEVCALADRLGVTLTLGTSVPKLKPWYEAMGFKPTQELKTGAYCATFYRRKPQ